VKFKPDARMSDISAFLGSNGMKIVGGPTADGVFRLGIPAANAADYTKQIGLIAAQPFAETVIEGRKPVDGG
ncbi:anti-sigma factor, partial [Mesorhizobium sp. M7A.F.Ca.CA.004.06.2.1]